MPQRDETLFNRPQLGQRAVRLVDGLHLNPPFTGIGASDTKFVRQTEEVADLRDAGMINKRGGRRLPDQTFDDHPQLAQQEDTVRLAIGNDTWRDLYREPMRLQLLKERRQRRGATGIMVHGADQRD